MTTLLQLVLLLSVIVSIMGGCGLELPYIIGTVLLLKLSWMVACWWRTFQQERENRWLHRRLACGSAMILLLSLSQLALAYFTTAIPEENDTPTASTSFYKPPPPLTQTCLPREAAPVTSSSPDDSSIVVQTDYFIE